MTAQNKTKEACPHCNGSGDIHRADGEWLARCSCAPVPAAGMTLRDHFAGQAMQGLLARGLHYQTEGANSPRHGLSEEDIAGHAYAMADAMLKVRDAS